MINNFWEEQEMGSSINIFHEQKMENVKLPSWVMDIKCPFCDRELPLRSVRNIQFCLNTRNFGDVAVEVFCDHCSKMDTLYFRKAATDVLDFCLLLEGEKKPNSYPIIEEDMYKMAYNNIIEGMLVDSEKGHEETKKGEQ